MDAAAFARRQQRLVVDGHHAGDQPFASTNAGK
jgi:hypothetical protein